MAVAPNNYALVAPGFQPAGQGRPAAGGNLAQAATLWRLGLRSAGYVLPNTALNQERMEWLANGDSNL